MWILGLLLSVPSAQMHEPLSGAEAVVLWLRNAPTRASMASTTTMPTTIRTSRRPRKPACSALLGGRLAGARCAGRRPAPSRHPGGGGAQPRRSPYGARWRRRTAAAAERPSAPAERLVRRRRRSGRGGRCRPESSGPARCDSLLSLLIAHPLGSAVTLGLATPSKGFLAAFPCASRPRPRSRLLTGAQAEHVRRVLGVLRRVDLGRDVGLGGSRCTAWQDDSSPPTILLSTVNSRRGVRAARPRAAAVRRRCP